MIVTLGLDTSCYTTSAAAVDTQGRVVAFSRKLLPVESGSRGLRQSEAVFVHLKQMPDRISEVMQQLNACSAEIAAVCVSAAPTCEAESYMPVFTVGHNMARILADTLRVPLYITNHQMGHIAAGLLGNHDPKGIYAAIHLSGGTTDLLKVDGEHITTLGGSADLHAGQLVDRIGVAMGLPFPAGPSLEKLAMENEETVESLLPVSFDKTTGYCHISGAEAQALRWLESGTYKKERIAAEIFDFLARTVLRLLLSADFNYSEALIVGGVSSSEYLRGLIAQRAKKLRKSPLILWGSPQYSSDNAAGVASIGMKKYMLEDHECLQQ